MIGDTANGGLALGGAATPAPFTIAVTPLATNDPTPPISGTVSTPSVNLTIRVNGVYYAVTNNNGAWTLPDGAISPPLANGIYDVLAAASNSGGQAAFDPTLNELTIDTAGPTATIGPVVPSTLVTPLGSIPIQFSEPVTGLSLRNLQLTIGGQSAPLLGATLTTSDNQNWTLGNLSGLTSADGNYQLSVIPADWNVTDSAGTPLTTTAVASWTMAAGTLVGNASNNVYRIVVDSVRSVKGRRLYQQFHCDADLHGDDRRVDAMDAQCGLGRSINRRFLQRKSLAGRRNDIHGFARRQQWSDDRGHLGGRQRRPATATQITVNGAAAINYSNIATFQFQLGAGQDNLSLNGATMRIVNGLDDAGTVTVNSGSNVTVDHVNEGALVIGGTADSPAVVTIAASDASGNPLAGSAGAATAAAIGASSISTAVPAEALSSIASGSALAGSISPSTTVSAPSVGRGADIQAVIQSLGSVFPASASPVVTSVADQSHSPSQDQSRVRNSSHPLVDAVLADDIVEGSRWLQWASPGESHADDWSTPDRLEASWNS